MSLFLAGGLHVSREPRVRTSQAGVPTGEVSPVSLLALRHPGAVHVIQSMGRAAELGLDALVGSGPPVVISTATPGIGEIPANHATTLRNRDGSRAEVYGALSLADVVDAVLIWDPADVEIEEPAASAFQVDWYWAELERRSLLLTGRPMDPSLRRAVGVPDQDVVTSDPSPEKTRSERRNGRSPRSASQPSTASRNPGTNDARRSDQ